MQYSRFLTEFREEGFKFFRSGYQDLKTIKTAKVLANWWFILLYFYTLVINHPFPKATSGIVGIMILASTL